ncbi:hypothetical protein ACEZCY_36215 [Streptacidiphilus sp. N1-12]|uniref:Integral membrane protein n=2 Tax=Streptacidiphilus alkalitolerans TaxID=3342712 RepID=A0ABV6VM73_9ACTN
MRIWATIGAALLLVLEALVTSVLALVLGIGIKRQNMSLGGLEPDRMALGVWVGLGTLAGFLVVVGAVLAIMAARRRAMGRPTRILLIVCAVLHAVLAAVTLALSGVLVFVVLIVTLGFLVLVIQLGPGRDAEPTPAP